MCSGLQSPGIFRVQWEVDMNFTVTTHLPGHSSSFQNWGSQGTGVQPCLTLASKILLCSPSYRCSSLQWLLWLPAHLACLGLSLSCHPHHISPEISQHVPGDGAFLGWTALRKHSPLFPGWSSGVLY